MCSVTVLSGNMNKRDKHWRTVLVLNCEDPWWVMSFLFIQINKMCLFLKRWIHYMWQNNWCDFTSWAFKLSLFRRISLRCSTSFVSVTPQTEVWEGLSKSEESPVESRGTVAETGFRLTPKSNTMRWTFEGWNLTVLVGPKERQRT